MLLCGFNLFSQELVKNNYEIIPVGNEQNYKVASLLGEGQKAISNSGCAFYVSEVMTTTYDLQSNGFLSNRMYQKPDGTVAVSATFSQQNGGGYTDRGTGYNISIGGDMNSWNDMPTVREEANATGSDVRTGWPSIAPYGENGEILVNHSSGLNFWIRETSGEGEWDGPYSIPDPTGLEGQQYSYQMSWPRVVTTGANNEVIHVFAASQYNIDANTTSNAQFYCRSTDGGTTWEVNWSPLQESDEHIDVYAADDYAVASNGETVAVIYSGSLEHHVVMYKSEDNGATWERRVVWENPYYGYDWNDANSVYSDTMYGPAHVALAIDNESVSHVALSSYMYYHAEVGTSYSVWRGLTSDGIVYWNDEQSGPIQSSNGNPHDALRLWVSGSDGYIYHIEEADKKFCGWIPNPSEVWNSSIYMKDDYFYAMLGTSAYPSIAVDAEGNLAVAYSSPDVNRVSEDGYYLRSIYVSYKPAGQENWNVACDNVYEDMAYSDDECISVSGITSASNANEFWFSYMVDNELGFYNGNGSTQQDITNSTIKVLKYEAGNYDANKISLSLNNKEGGIAKGAGFYADNETVTVVAIPNEKFEFVGWTEGGILVSTDVEYSFVVEQSRHLVANFLRDIVETPYDVIYTTYDLQSNSMLSNRMYQNEDGDVAVVAMFSQDISDEASDRGTAYNICVNGDSWNEIPTERIEDNDTLGGYGFRTGWPSIAKFCDGGEILFNHNSEEGILYWDRNYAGNEEWCGPCTIPNPVGLDGQEYELNMTWPRVVTSGINNQIVHVIAAAQYTVGNVNKTYQLYCRRMDINEEWEVNWSPLYNDNEHIDAYNADDYAIAANGDVVAILYTGSLEHHTVIYKSTDNGDTWERKIVWENPYYGYDWNHDEETLFDSLYAPVHASLAVDNEKVVHVALSTALYGHTSFSDVNVYDSYFSDGIAYWNDLQTTPIQSVYDDNPNNALRLWWNVPGTSDVLFRDSINFCAYMPQHPETGLQYFSSYNVYKNADYSNSFDGLSAYPAIAVDPVGNIAVAYSAPDMTRLYNYGYYYRSMFISYKPAGSNKWYNSAKNFYKESEELSESESVFVSAVSNPVNENEFWFSCLSDDIPGFFRGNNVYQPYVTKSAVQAFKYDANDFDKINVSLVLGHDDAAALFGAGEYAKEAPVTVKAVAKDGYLFVNWTENGNVVSTNSEYSFTSSEDRKLVANFKTDKSIKFKEVMTTTYDLQSNGFLSNRMYQKPDGTVAVSATFSQQNGGGYTDRGTGYNISIGGDMNSWNDMPTVREEANATGSDVRTGWPSIAPYGENGEILVNHSSGLNFWIRETSGEGEWDGPYSIPDPTGLEGQQYSYQMSWPRVVTTGANNEVIHVFAASQYNIDANTTSNAQFYCRSTDGGTTWEVNWSPLQESDEHIDVYAADDYAVASNGETVAVIYSGSLEHHVVMYKSEDNGATWERRVVWENPYYGYDWNDANSVYSDTMYGPAHVALAIDNESVSHVALSSYMYYHAEVGTSYSVWRGLTSDGIVYWNDEQSGPIQSSNGNPHDALRLWVSGSDGYIYHIEEADKKFCGWIPNPSEVWNSSIYMKDDYFYAMLGTSAYPSIAVDAEGNLAVAYSSPDVNRVSEDGYYLRSIYVSYKPAGQENWNVACDNMYDYVDLDALMDECLSVTAVNNPVNINEFWFSFLTDNKLGLYNGNNASQQTNSVSSVKVAKFKPENHLKKYVKIDVEPYNAGFVYKNNDILDICNGYTSYYLDTPVTLNVYTNDGFIFVNWTENGEVVSTEPDYYFIVDSNRSLVANFEAIETPSNLNATTIDLHTIKLTWDEADNALSYNVYRDDVFVGNVTETSFTDENLTPDKEYCYKVTSVNGDYESDYSNEACAKTDEDSIEEYTIDLNIYPNPVECGSEIYLGINYSKVEVYNAIGVKVAEYSNVDKLDGIETSGVYMIRVMNDNEMRNYRVVVE